MSMLHVREIQDKISASQTSNANALKKQNTYIQKAGLNLELFFNTAILGGRMYYVPALTVP